MTVCAENERLATGEAGPRLLAHSTLPSIYPTRPDCRSASNDRVEQCRFVLVLIVFLRRWHRGSCRSNYNTTSARLFVLWVQRLGRNVSSSGEKYT